MNTETENVSIGGDDAALFNEITTGAEPQAVIEPQKVEAVAEIPAQPVQEREQTRVPLSELIEERRARQGIEKQMQELIATMRAGQPKPEPTQEPQIWDDPRAFVHAEINPILQQQHQAIMYNARMAAEARFGEDSVKAAEAEFNRLVAEGQMHPAERDRINDSPNPFAEAVKWHKRQSVVSEVGDDLTAYNAKLKAQLLDDPEFRKEMMAKLQQQAGSPPQGRGASPPISLPSLSKVGATALPSNDGNESDDDLWKTVTASKRR